MSGLLEICLIALMRSETFQIPSRLASQPLITENLVEDEIPTADLIIVRDVLGHLPLEDGVKAVENILSSDCKYLLSTTWAKLNVDTGEWEACANGEVDRENEGVDYGRFYPVNLMVNPFNFPMPELLIDIGPIEILCSLIIAN